MGENLIKTVEQSCLKQMANQKVIKPPVVPISLVKRNFNMPVNGIEANAVRLKTNLPAKKTFTAK